MGSGLRETKCHLSGVTLLECLITLTIVAILMCIGVPAYRDQLASARARAGAQQLYAAMQYALSMAQLRGAVVTLCPVVDPSNPALKCAGHFGQVFAAIKHSGEDSQLLRVWPPVTGVTVTNRTGSNWVTGELRWNPQGVGRRNLTLSVCALGHNWSVITNRLGRPRLARDWGLCPSGVPR
jgi:type IV fimbrial biogenesis protein FimT